MNNKELLKNMLYCRHSEDNADFITKEFFESVQKEAMALLSGTMYIDPELQRHWESIANGEVPNGYVVVEQLKIEF